MAFGLSKKAADSLLRRSVSASLANNFGPISQLQSLGAFSIRAPDAVAESASSPGTTPPTSGGIAIMHEVDDLLRSSALPVDISTGSVDPFPSRKQATSNTTPFALGIAQFWNPPSLQNAASLGLAASSKLQPAADSGIILGLNDASPEGPQVSTLIIDFESALEGAEYKAGIADDGGAKTTAALHKLAPDQVKTLTSAGIRLKGRSSEELMQKAQHVRQRRRESAARSRHKKIARYHELQDSNEKLRQENEKLRQLLKNLQQAYINEASDAMSNLGGFQ